MNQNIKLAFANMRRKKAGMITLGIIILVVTVLLSLGLSVTNQIDKVVSKKMVTYNTADIMGYCMDEAYNNEVEDFLNNYEFIKEREVVPAIIMSSGGFKIKDEVHYSACMFEEFNAEKKISKYQIIDKVSVSGNNVCYLPYKMKSLGINASETVTLINGDYEIDLIVGGFVEDLLTGATGMGYFRVVLPHEIFAYFTAELPFYKAKMFFIELIANKYESQFNKDFGLINPGEADDGLGYLSCDYVTKQEGKAASTVFLGIISALLIVFSVIMLLVTLIVMRFSINNMINEDKVKYGVLKAIGYKTNDIRKSILFQYMFITMIASIMGALLSVFVVGALSGLVATMVGITWKELGDLSIAFVALLAVCLVVLLIIMLISKKIGKIYPVDALRNKETSKRNKKEIFTLSNSRLNLDFSLGIKNITSNLVRSITVVIITSCMVFACGMIAVMNYNFNDDKSSLIKLVGVPYGMGVTINDENITNIVNEIKAVSQVDDVYQFGMIGGYSSTVDEEKVIIIVSNDFSKVVDKIYKGQFVQNDNEVLVNDALLSKLNKKIGDEVSIKVSNESKTFVICGTTQNIQNMGSSIVMNEGGMQRLVPDYQVSAFFVKSDLKYDELKVILEAKFDSTKVMYTDYGKIIMDTLDTFSVATKALMIAVILATLFIISLILFLLINSKIVKEKRQYAIMKSIGYTNKSIIKQSMISFMTLLIIGLIIGTALAFLFSNNIMSLFLGAVGISELKFIIPVNTIILIDCLIIAISILVLLVSLQPIKKVSTYELLID